MASIVLFLIALAIVSVSVASISYELVFAQQGGGSPKVDIFSKQVSDTSILVTWENPSDTEEDIPFRYTVYRDVNRSENFVEVFNSIRDIEEKIINNNGQEMFFYLDQDIRPGNDYTYQVLTGRPKGNPNPQLSDDTRPIFIHPREKVNEITSHGKLITGRTLTQITPVISWFNWFNVQDAQADTFVNDVFTTSLNPQVESYRMILEPIPSPLNQTLRCNEIFDFQYSKNLAKGQDFVIITSILEKEITKDDNPPSYQESYVLRAQHTFDDFTDSDKIKNKQFAIHPINQTILNYSALEVQFDIAGDFTADINEYRSITIWDMFFIVPEGNNC